MQKNNKRMAIPGTGHWHIHHKLQPNLSLHHLILDPPFGDTQQSPTQNQNKKANNSAEANHETRTLRTSNNSISSMARDTNP